jgi:hypothetical protein
VKTGELLRHREKEDSKGLMHIKKILKFETLAKVYDQRRALFEEVKEKKQIIVEE